MSVQALQGMKDHAEELLNVITADTMLPDWAEFKIARASQSLTSVFEYMNHGEGALKQAKTAKVDIKPLRGKVRFYVLQAQGNHFKAKEIPARASNFWARVGKVIDNVRDENGNLIFYGMPSGSPDDVVVECTRGGMAFSLRFEAQYNEPGLDILDHLKALKKAFVAEGIAF